MHEKLFIARSAAWFFFITPSTLERESCHPILDPNFKPGMSVSRGQVLGTVGIQRRKVKGDPAEMKRGPSKNGYSLEKFDKPLRMNCFNRRLRLSTYRDGQVPVYQNAEGEQLSPPSFLRLKLESHFKGTWHRKFSQPIFLVFSLVPIPLN